MFLSELTLRNFRNLAEISCVFNDGINIIRGENAQGKTNLLEAVYFLSAVRSFRATKEAELIRFGQNFTEVTGKTFLEVRGNYPAELNIRIFNTKRRELLINGVGKRRLSDFCGILKTVLFLPEDLGIVQDGASARRRLLDSALSQMRPAYRKLLTEYNKTISHKQRILKEGSARPDMTDALWVYNRKLAETGGAIINYRARLINALAKHTAVIHSEISDGREILSLNYKTDSRVEDPFSPPQTIAAALFMHMEERTGAEFAAGSCLIGPHRDDCEISINGLAARTYASQGQARTAALALKLAEREILREDSGELPLLLLDDVLSELDSLRRDYVLTRISGGQVIITTCGDETLSSDAGVFIVKNGMVIRA